MFLINTMEEVEARRRRLEKNGWLTIPSLFRELLGDADSVWVTNFILAKERCLVLCKPSEPDRYDAILKDQTDQEKGNCNRLGPHVSS